MSITYPTLNRRNTNATRVMAAASTIFLMLTGCGGESDRYETISKLRSLGVAQTPVNAKPGDTVALTYYLAGPKGLNISTELKKDTNAPYSIVVQPSAVSDQVTETQYGALSLYTYQASVVMPSDSSMSALLAKNGYARVRSMAIFTTPDQEREDVVTDSITYPPSSSQLNWGTPELSISSPTGTTTSANVNLEGALSSNDNESMRIAWFVSSGKVKNREARVTTWEDAGVGSQTVFFTARGSKSGAFAVKAINIQVQ